MTIAYRSVGGGPEKVLALHGWLTGHSIFEPLMPWLDTDRFTVVFADARGYEGSADQPGDYAIDEIGEDAIALADSLGWDSFHLLGHFMGGMAAQFLAMAARERLKSIAVLAPAPACGLPLDEESRDLFEGAAEHAENRGVILSYGTGQRLGEIWERVMVRRSFETSRPEAVAGYFQAWAGTDFAEEVEGIDIPIKILIGEHDRIITAELMWDSLMKWFPAAELEILANCGHYPMQEIPVRLAHVLHQFFTTHA